MCATISVPAPLPDCYIAQPSLIERAAAGDIEAHREIIRNVLALDINPIETTAIAEVHSRFAAAIGGAYDWRNLGHVLMLKGAAALDAGDGATNALSQTEAAWWLDRAADAGDEDAAVDLNRLIETMTAVDISLSLRWRDAAYGAARKRMSDIYHDALMGDTTALDDLYDDAILDRYNIRPPVVSLAQAEMFARIGAASGTVEDLRRLAGTLMVRANYDHDNAGLQSAVAPAVEAIVILYDLVDGGADDALLTQAIGSIPSVILKHAVAERPFLLLFATPEGGAH